MGRESFEPPSLKRFGVTGIPVEYVIGPEGKIRFGGTGGVMAGRMEELVEHALKN